MGSLTRCTPPRQRHVFDTFGKCVHCQLETNRALSLRPALTKPDVPTSGTLVKLQHLTKLYDAFDQSRSELVKFVSQHSGLSADTEDPLFERVQTFMDILYKDLGRETFWSK